MGIEIEDLKTVDKTSSMKNNSLLSILALAVSPVSLPLALCITAYEVFALSMNNSEELKKPMPDNWLKKVSESNEVSKEGLKFLAKKLDKKGFISVQEAYDWAKLEEELAEKKLKELEKEKKKQGEGALLLLNRLKSESYSFDISFDISFEDTLNKINSIVNFEDNFLLKLKEKVKKDILSKPMGLLNLNKSDLIDDTELLKVTLSDIQKLLKKYHTSILDNFFEEVSYENIDIQKFSKVLITGSENQYKGEFIKNLSERITDVYFITEVSDLLNYDFIVLYKNDNLTDNQICEKFGILHKLKQNELIILKKKSNEEK